MNLNEYQNGMLRTCQPRVSTDPTLVRLTGFACGIAGEAGEIADHAKKAILQGHTLDKIKLLKELGDVMWYVAALAFLLDTDLETVASMNLEKLKARYPDGFTVERSLNRGE